jgi:hypothetical protein
MLVLVLVAEGRSAVLLGDVQQLVQQQVSLSSCPDVLSCCLVARHIGCVAPDLETLVVIELHLIGVVVRLLVLLLVLLLLLEAEGRSGVRLADVQQLVQQQVGLACSSGI